MEHGTKVLTEREKARGERARLAAVALIGSPVEDRGLILAQALTATGADAAAIANVLRATAELLDAAQMRRASALN